MSKNLIPEICKLLGVELGEEFKIKNNTGTLDSISLNSVYAFVKQDSLEGARLTVSTGESRPLYMPPRPLEPIALKVFELLCRGKCEVVKIPWKPKMYEEYWTFGKLGCKWTLRTDSWKACPYEILLLDKGWVFRTRAEAETALPAAAEKVGVEYEI